MKWEYSKDKKSIIFDDNNFYIKSQDNTFKEVEQECHIKAHGERNLYVISVLFRYAKRSQINSALDIGARYGVSLSLFGALGIEALGVDISPRTVEKAQRNGENVILGDAHHLSDVINKKFDVILMIHSLEHCYDPSKVLRECYKALNDGGYIAVRLPIQKDLTHQRNKKGDHGELPTHFSVFTLDGLESFLTVHDFDVIHKEYKTNGRNVHEAIMIGKKE